MKSYIELNQPYREVVIKKFDWLQKSDSNFQLKKLYESNIKDQLKWLVLNYEKLTDQDQFIIKNYLEEQNDKKLLEILKKDKEKLAKNILRLFSQETKKPQKDGLLDICALLVDIRPRPFKMNFDYSQIKIEKPIASFLKSKKKRRSEYPIIGLVSIVAIVGLVLFFSYFLKKETNPKDTSPTNNYHIENMIVSEKDQIFPDKETQYFDANGEPKIWYTKYNGQLELYNTIGIHHKTNKPLQPITKDVIEVIYLEKENSNTKNEDRKVISEPKPHLINTSIKNTKDKKQLSLFVLDENFKVDANTTTSVKQILKEEGYSITSQLIASSDINLKVMSNLQTLNQDFFKTDLNNYTDYLCLGAVTYNYSNNNKNLKTCELTLDYSIISTKNGEEIDVLFKTISGIGSSEQSAKQNALFKLTL